MNENNIEQYYNDCDESRRLKINKVHLIEYLTTFHFLEKHLPKGCSVLDCCAGCGVYAFPLAKNGYIVTAADLMAKHVDIMNSSVDSKYLQDVFQINTLDMSKLSDNSFDAVICLGALYHLLDEADRKKTVSECLRVLKSGGIFMFSYLNRNASFINIMKKCPPPIEQGLAIMQNGRKNADLFYGMDFDESDKLADAFNLEKITNAGTDGLIYPLYNELNALDENQFELYMSYHLATCEQPSIIGHSMHGLWIGRKL